MVDVLPGGRLLLFGNEHNNLVVALWGDDSAGDCVEALVASNESEFVTRIVVANFDLAECDGHGVISLFAG